MTTQEREIKGRTDELPRAGMQLGERVPLAPPYPVVANFPTQPEIAALLRESALGRGRRISCCSIRASRTAMCGSGSRRAFRRCGTSPTRCNGSRSRAALAVIYFVTNVAAQREDERVSAHRPAGHPRRAFITLVRVLIALALLFFRAAWRSRSFCITGARLDDRAGA